MQHFTITQKKEIPLDRVSDLIGGALDGAIGYWGGYDSSKCKPADTPDRFRSKIGGGSVDFLCDYPLTLGGYLTLIDHEEDGKEHILDFPTVERGLTIFQEKYPRYFADFLTENDDNETADAFIQCCLFGEVIYG